MFRTWWMLLALALVHPASSHADEFRCDTDVFVGEEKELVQESLTLFTGKVIHDFPVGKSGKGGEITVYNLERGTIELLNPHRKLRCTIHTEDLIRFTALYKTRKAESDLFKFCIQPAFEKTFEDDTLTLASPHFTYAATGVKPQQPGAERLYREFADWSAQLNSMRPGNLPPFPRLELNEALAAHDMLPQEITRTIVTQRLTRKTETVRSHHLFNWLLSGSDRQRIEEVGDLRIKCTSVSPDDYLGLTKKTAGN